VVLIGGEGGLGEAIPFVERYDAAADRWTFVGDADLEGGIGPFAEAPYDHATVPLADGTMLVVAGFTDPFPWGVSRGRTYTERFDPATGESVTEASHVYPFQRPVVAQLLGGDVLLTGWDGDRGPAATTSWAVYDTDLREWGADMPLEAGVPTTATTLATGAVLVTFTTGVDPRPPATTALFLPLSTTWLPGVAQIEDTWVETTPMSTIVSANDAFLLEDGKVLVIGYDDHRTLAAEVFDPVVMEWTPASPPPAGFVSAQLSDGRILSVSGPSSAVYDPETDEWTPLPPMDGLYSSFEPALTPLPDGSALLSGGGATFIFRPSM
jgi:hypothetical protein